MEVYVRFIKFKIAFYPSRVHYGNIDPGKIDVINLDFYNLYSQFDANKMEENAVNFTKRLLNNHFMYFSGNIEKYFNILEAELGTREFKVSQAPESQRAIVEQVYEAMKKAGLIH